MESNEAVALLVQATLVGSAAIAVVMAAGRPLRRAFGARAAYAAWWLVPSALLALAIPAAPSSGLAEIGVGFAAPLGVATGFAGRAAGTAWQAWALAAWGCGALASALAIAMAQAKFRAALGMLQLRGDAWLAECPADGLPATIGLLAPRVVLPPDFHSRYEACQRELILEHERTHVARGDAWANLAVAVLRCLCWFNPLVHVAARRFRHDQELACDAVVVERHPRLRRAYGDALLRAQLVTQGSPLACHFGFAHPLRERIAMLKGPFADRRRRIAGHAAVATLASVAAFAAWAAQPQDPHAPAGHAPRHDVVAEMRIDPAEAQVDEMRITPPVYPREALDEGVGGKVVLLIDVAADGRITGVSIESATDDRLARAAAKNAWNWKFRPRTKNGKAVAGRVRVPVMFTPTEPQQQG